MKTILRHSLFAAAALAALSLTPANAAESGIKVGVLSCNVASGWGFVFGSSKQINCNYRPTAGRSVDRYVGDVSKFGVDIGYTDGGVIVWNVVAPTSDIRAGALEGEYAGASASAAIGVGLGANVLVGGLDKSIALQPISIEGMTGLNVAAGIGSLSLKAVPRS